MFLHLHDEENVQRPPPNVQCRMQTSELDVGRCTLGIRRFLLTCRRLFASAPPSLVLRLISLRLSAADRALPCVHRLACSRAQSTPALLRSPALAQAWARARCWLLPMPPPLRARLLIREQFARLSFFQGR